MFVFDYDGTLAEHGHPLPVETADALALFLALGESVSVLTSRARPSMRRKGVDVGSSVLEAVKRMYPATTCAKAGTLLRNLHLFTSKGSKKYGYRHERGNLVEQVDSAYTRIFTTGQKERLVGLVREVEDDIGVRGEDGPDSVRCFESDTCDGYTNVALRCPPGTAIHEKKHQVADEIRRRLRDAGGMPPNVSVMVIGNTISITARNKDFAVTHMIGEMGAANVQYYGDDPTGTDKPVFDLSATFDDGRLACTQVRGPSDVVFLAAIHEYLNRRGIRVRQVHPDAFAVIRDEAAALPARCGRRPEKKRASHFTGIPRSGPHFGVFGRQPSSSSRRANSAFCGQDPTWSYGRSLSASGKGTPARTRSCT